MPTEVFVDDAGFVERVRITGRTDGRLIVEASLAAGHGAARPVTLDLPGALAPIDVAAVRALRDLFTRALGE